MSYIDIFNGDADGLCALLQLRHAQPLDSRLITGTKREIQLVKRVQAAPGDHLTVLDIAFEKNRDSVLQALHAGAAIWYADHHEPGEIPQHERLTVLVDTAADVCTSLLVNRHVEGRYAAWAVTGAFGDNMDVSARVLGQSSGLDEHALDCLKRLGTYLNYNSYGLTEDDLHFRPADLFRKLLPYRNPLDFAAENGEVFRRLEAGYQEDMAAARSLAPCREGGHSAVYLLPSETWSRRVSGVFGNYLARQHPQRAHAIVMELPSGEYRVSVRSALTKSTGAAELCCRFPSGGGRAAAAGINHLPADMLEQFLAAFEEFYRQA